MTGGFIPPHGGYRSLLSYRKSEIVYDATVVFCNRFLKKSDRTFDQMVQAARSGKQNIAEGSLASGTSKETEIKLTNVARASLEELRLDYEDYLRTNGLELWNSNSQKAIFVRELGANGNDAYETYKMYVETRTAGVVANIVICLICQATFLLDRQIKSLETSFITNGGIKEQMTAARRQERNNQRKARKQE